MSDPDAPARRAVAGPPAARRGGIQPAAGAPRVAAPSPPAPSPPTPPIDRQALAEQYIPYVRAIAGKVKRTVAKEIEFEDLVEYGMVGLMEAASRFDPALGANFMTFAYYRVRGAIYDGLRGMGWMSRTAYAKARFEERANALMAELSQRGEPRAMAPAERLHHTVDDLAHAVTGLAAVYITSLDAAEHVAVGDAGAPAADEAMGLAQARQIVRQTVEKLGEQERQLLELYYYQDKSLQEVGEALGLSKSWTSRLHARVIDKLHRLLEAQLG